MDDLAREQSGSGADVEDVHARPQPRAVERLAPIALAGAERHDAARAVVVFRRSIEQRVDDTLPIVGAGPVAGFSGQRWLIHGRLTACATSRGENRTHRCRRTSWKKSATQRRVASEGRQ